LAYIGVIWERLEISAVACPGPACELVRTIHRSWDHSHSRQWHARTRHIGEGDRGDQQLRDTWTFMATAAKGYFGLETGAAVVYICG